MLLKNIGKTVKTRARADIEKANRGEKVSVGGVREAPPKKKFHAPVKAETFSPLEQTGLPENFISRVVSAQDDAPEAKRHNTGHMHLSALLKSVCARQTRFTDENPDKQVLESVTGGHRVMWKLGRAVESHIRESYIRGVKFKGVYGVWKCACGALEKKGYFQEGPSCGRCRMPAERYNEATLFDHEAGIVGNPDFLVKISDPLHVTEIKSMNPEDFDGLRAPLPDHIYQAGGYRRLLLRNDMEVSPIGIIIYCTKKFVFGRPYKEFHVNLDTRQIDGVLDTAWATASHIRRSREKQTIPAERVCQSINSPLAKKCPHVGDCFSGAY